jgi:PAS domain S-box-containing protein
MQMPPVDYHTLFLTSGLTGATLLALLAIQARKTYPGFVRIVVALDLLTAAIVIADLKGYTSDTLWVIQVSSILAFALTDSGIRLFCASPRRGRWPLVYVEAAIILQTYLFIAQPPYVRILVNSLLLPPIFIDATLPFLREPPKGCRFGYRFTAAVLLLGCLAAFVRIVAISYLSEHPRPYFSTHPANTLFFFLIMFLLVSLAFGFIALTHERLVADLEKESAERARVERELAEAERLTHARFKALFEQSPAFAAILDVDGTVREVSRAPIEVCGYTREQVIGLPFWQTPWWRSSKEVQEELRTATAQAAAGQAYRDVLPYVSADDSAHVVEFGIHPIFDDSGNVIFLHPTGIDITERVRAEQGLRRAEERYRIQSERLLLALEASQSGTFEWNLKDNVQNWGPMLEKLYGLEPGDFPTTYKEWLACIYPPDVPQAEQAARESLTTGFNRAQFRIRRKSDGQLRWMLSSARVHFDQEGKPERMIGINVDVTEQKRMEDALLESESKFRAFMDNSPAIAWMKDAQGKFVYLNRAYESRFGIRLEDCSDKTDFDVFPTELAQLYRDHDRSALATNRPVQAIEETPNPDGSSTTWHVTKFPFSTVSGDRFVAGIGVDITERKRNEEKIALSEQRYRSLARASSQLVWTCDAFGYFGHEIEDWQRFTGQTADEVHGFGWLDAIHPEDRDKTLKAWQHATEARSAYAVECRLRRHDGTYRVMQERAAPVFDSTGQVLEWIGMSTDVTEQRLAEERLRRDEKLAVAGRLALNVSHEINNPLAAITNFIYLVAGDPGLSEATRKYLGGAERELARVSQAVARNLRFSKASSPSGDADLRELTDSVIEFFQARLETDHISVERDYRTDARLRCHPDELQVVIANLFGNAHDAMRKGGKLKIRIREAHNWNSPVAQGLKLTIADTGIGIPRDLRHRIFEPFFTTKQETGAGLGLWTCSQIVLRHQGQIKFWTSTAPSHSGTVFNLFFPFQRFPAAHVKIRPAA